MSIFQGMVLGLVQGVTEFVPISSSAHLVLVPELLGWPAPSVAYIVLLHAATLLALLIHFGKHLLGAIRGAEGVAGRRLIYLLAIGTLPAAAIGVMFERQFEDSFGHPVQVALQLAFTGLILIGAELLARRRTVQGAGEMGKTEATKLTTSSALAIGFAQAVSIVPGISRSGATIGTGLVAGLGRAEAARFSFMLAIPILFGTSLYKIPELTTGGLSAGAMVAGFLASLVSGYLAIAGMVGYLQRRGLYPFAAYCVIAGLLAALAL